MLNRLAAFRMVSFFSISIIRPLMDALAMVIPHPSDRKYGRQTLQ
jgi:hypothetical protein